MNAPDNMEDKTLLQDWYRYAIEQSWTTEFYLRLARTHDFKTREQQRSDFGASEEDFLRLRALPQPRSDAFIKDCQQMAHECHLQNPDAFIQAMLLARQVALSAQSTTDPEQYYEAAFDAIDDSPEQENGSQEV